MKTTLGMGATLPDLLWRQSCPQRKVQAFILLKHHVIEFLSCSHRLLTPRSSWYPAQKRHCLDCAHNKEASNAQSH